MFDIIKKIFGTPHERAVRKMKPMVRKINDLESEIEKLSDAKLQAKTAEFRERIDNGEKIDKLLFESFAVVREASKRVLGMRHFDVQLMGGIVLHQGKIAEMRTGEGKTLVATLPAYLNALEGKGVHIVTVNDYLARRDAEWMGELYTWLGLTVGSVVNHQPDWEKRAAYKSDIAYGQNNEFGFDYLRDNMKFSALDYAQKPLNYAIIDEVDSILIDEARTPLIISGQGQRSSHKYRLVNDLIPRLRNEEHYAVDEKGHSVTLTDEGIEATEVLLKEVGALEGTNLYDPVNLETLHIVNTEHLPFSFSFEKSSFASGAGDGAQVVSIEPLQGVVGPDSTLPIEVTFTHALRSSSSALISTPKREARMASATAVTAARRSVSNVTRSVPYALSMGRPNAPRKASAGAHASCRLVVSSLSASGSAALAVAGRVK